MKYKIIIFDLDGTILDTLDDLTDSVNFSLENNLLPPRSKEEVRSFLGNGIRNLIEKSVPDNTQKNVLEKVFSDFSTHYALHSCDKTKPYEGICSLIDELRKIGIKTAVVSNKVDSAVKNLIDRYFYGLFDYVSGERTGIKRKPSPDSVLDAINTLGGKISDVLYVGDSEVDVQTSFNADIDHIIVDWGFRDREYLMKFNANCIVSTVNELRSYILQ